MKLLLFNPETEYALASGASFYTPPARIEKLRKELQLLPEAWAEEGDLILVDDIRNLSSKFRLVQWEDLEDVFSEMPELVIDPWGWNQALVRRLKDCGVPESRLPDRNRILRIRELAHRHTTILLNSLWNESVEEKWKVDVPNEFISIEDCLEFYRDNRGCWMKAPWSSSGRGVINTAADMTDELVEQWCRGIIRRQGSVMCETGAERVADYATEWKMTDGNASFLGLSSFSTSNRGKYIANENMSQALMKKKFNSESGVSLDVVVRLQKEILEKVLMGYEGLFGVDMILETNGKLRPFVEVNLRRTMGMLHIMA